MMAMTITTGYGTGPSDPRLIWAKPAVNLPGATDPSRRINPDETDWPSTGTSFKPCIKNMVARVARRSGILSATISKALNAPMSAPAMMTATNATQPCWA